MAWLRNRAHDTVGVVTTLTTIVPVISGHEDDLRATLDGLSVGEASPFALLERTHFARFQLIDGFGTVSRRASADSPLPTYLVCSACLDGDIRSYALELHQRFGTLVDDIWGHTVGCPGHDDGEAFVDWLLAHRIAHTFSWGTTPWGTAVEVREAVSLRRRLAAFAVDHGGTTDGLALRHAFDRAFGRV
jgi:hypothetical protein